MLHFITDGTTYKFIHINEAGVQEYVVDVNDPRMNSIMECIDKMDEEALIKLVSTSPEDIEKEKEINRIKKVVKEYKNLCIDVFDDNTVEASYKGVKLPEVLVDKLNKLINKGYTAIDPYILFLENIMANPSDRSKEELYSFLAHNYLPITSDGMFIAYKGIDEDGYSRNGNKDVKVISGTVDSYGRIYNGNSGEIIEIRRTDVEEDASVACSTGLHVGAWEYAHSFGNKVIAVLVDPRDVVSVPYDCNAQKCRTSKYRVIRDIHEPIPSDVFTNVTDKMVIEAIMASSNADAGKDSDSESPAEENINSTDDIINSMSVVHAVSSSCANDPLDVFKSIVDSVIEKYNGKKKWGKASVYHVISAVRKAEKESGISFGINNSKEMFNLLVFLGYKLRMPLKGKRVFNRMKISNKD